MVRLPDAEYQQVKKRAESERRKAANWIEALIMRELEKAAAEPTPPAPMPNPKVPVAPALRIPAPTQSPKR